MPSMAEALRKSGVNGVGLTFEKIENAPRKSLLTTAQELIAEYPTDAETRKNIIFGMIVGNPAFLQELLRDYAPTAIPDLLEKARRELVRRKLLKPSAVDKEIEAKAAQKKSAAKISKEWWKPENVAKREAELQAASEKVRIAFEKASWFDQYVLRDGMAILDATKDKLLAEADAEMQDSDEHRRKAKLYQRIADRMPNKGTVRETVDMDYLLNVRDEVYAAAPPR